MRLHPLAVVLALTVGGAACTARAQVPVPEPELPVLDPPPAPPRIVAIYVEPEEPVAVEVPSAPEPAAPPRPQQARPAMADDDLSDELPDDAFDDSESSSPGRASPPVIDGTAQPRVAARAPAPKPGKRLAREAQPSLLDDEAYQLPPLALLAEPRKQATPSVSTEALEQNALAALEMSDRAYILVLGRNAREGAARELAADPDIRRLFLGG